MIRVSVCYPNDPNVKFDMDYYVNKHLAMVSQKLTPLGLVRHEADRGVASAQPGAPAPFVAIGYMYFNNMQDFQKCMAPAAEMMADIPNFTNVQPQVQISEIVG
jgi:uncharacterized protein (TIGR02118 family)